MLTTPYVQSFHSPNISLRRRTLLFFNEEARSTSSAYSLPRDLILQLNTDHPSQNLVYRSTGRCDISKKSLPAPWCCDLEYGMFSEVLGPITSILFSPNPYTLIIVLQGKSLLILEITIPLN
ncbi:hypothetical protein NPIL_602061 [Nephila pilipes]|uniref:Uncharacterized protein n=1 Tax=Nephila pilipes TaxID=299642 RepID=A0A8X6NHY0_NEPPI|nr:hypothetical protein NPIL_602061 [Nephila pilipes]